MSNAALLAHLEEHRPDLSYAERRSVEEGRLHEVARAYVRRDRLQSRLQLGGGLLWMVFASLQYAGGDGALAWLWLLPCVSSFGLSAFLHRRAGRTENLLSELGA